ncbi:hypothetical protein [Thalassomonas viridans]|nr:hypothetical protein [Thalassomonas viridans]
MNTKKDPFRSKPLVTPTQRHESGHHQAADDKPEKTTKKEQKS